MGYFLPDPRYEMQQLFIPGEKPNRSVTIDWSHKFARGLLVAIPFANGGEPVELVRREKLQFGLSGTLPTRLKDGFSFPGGAQQTLDLTELVYPDSTPFSYTFEVKGDGSATLSYVLGTSSTNQDYVRLQEGTRMYWASGGSAWRFNAVTNFQTRSIYTITCDGNLGIKLWKDGAFVQNASNSRSTSNFKLSRIGRTGAGTGGFDGSVYYVSVHDWEMKAGAIAEYHRNLFQYLIPV